MNIQKPIVFFDVEATGLDVARDRIVSFAAERVVGWDFSADRPIVEGKIDLLINPGMQMSEEVIAIHGITNEAVVGLLPFEAHAHDLCNYFAGCDLAGFNLWNFDIPLLWEEFYRAGITWDLSNVHVLDAGNIFKKKEERTLSAALEFYCGRKHENAHDGWADVQATIDVLAAQIRRYQDLSKMTVEQLAEFSRFDRRVDLAGKIVLNDQCEPVYAIGKSKGTRVKDDPSFAYWMLSRDFPLNTKMHLERILEEINSEPEEEGALL